jgi:hypothetical protein
VVTGKPYMLYNWPQALEVEKMSLEPDPKLLSQLENETSVHGMLSFL